MRALKRIDQSRCEMKRLFVAASPTEAVLARSSLVP